MAKPLVVITGASSGIGAATAQAFAADGHPLLLLARRIDRMKALGLPNAMCRVVDVRDREAIAIAIQDAEAKYGPTDCLFNNAGIARLGDITKQNPAEWDEMIDINVNGVMAAPRPAWTLSPRWSTLRSKRPNSSKIAMTGAGVAQAASARFLNRTA